jgi:type IX secretion system PorP/SprF family membrane protein
MTVKRFIAVVFIALCGLEGAKAQWDAQVSNYWVVKQAYNPAFAGQGNLLNLSILGRQQWVGVENAPKTFWASAEMPIRFMNKVHGVGINLSNDQFGLYSNTYINGQYAYKKKIKNNTFNIGLQVGMAGVGFDATKLYNPQSNAHSSKDDAIPTSSEKASVLDAGVGVTWLARNYYVGLSAAHVLQPKYDLGEKISSHIPRAYYLIAGGNINLSNPLYQIQPSTLVKRSGNVLQMDLTARFVYNKLFNAGVSWRKDDGLVFLLGASIKGFNVGYSYDWSTSAISQVSSGSHELYVTYSMPIDLDRSKRRSSKSVRIL